MARKNKSSGRDVMPAEPSVTDANPHYDPAPYEHIAERAYALYLERGASHGRDLEDWLAAERELSSPARRRNGSGDR